MLLSPSSLWLGDNDLPTVFLHDTFLYDHSDFLVDTYINGFLIIQAMPWHSIFVDQTYIFRENRKNQYRVPSNEAIFWSPGQRVCLVTEPDVSFTTMKKI